MRRLAVLLALMPAAAGAALPPCVYEEMIAEAPLAFQMQVTGVAGPDREGICRVSGEVLQAFRGDLTAGPVVVRVPCLNRKGLIGPVIWTDEAALRGAAVMEVYGAVGQGVAGHGAGLFLLPAPTDTPVFAVSENCR